MNDLSVAGMGVMVLDKKSAVFFVNVNWPFSYYRMVVNGENSETMVSESDSTIKEQSDIPGECLFYCWRRGGMGMGILKVVAATPMPSSHELGGMVAT